MWLQVVLFTVLAEWSGARTTSLRSSGMEQDVRVHFGRSSNGLRRDRHLGGESRTRKNQHCGGQDPWEAISTLLAQCVYGGKVSKLFLVSPTKE